MNWELINLIKAKMAQEKEVLYVSVPSSPAQVVFIYMIPHTFHPLLLSFQGPPSTTHTTGHFSPLHGGGDSHRDGLLCLHVDLNGC